MNSSSFRNQKINNEAFLNCLFLMNFIEENELLLPSKGPQDFTILIWLLT